MPAAAERDVREGPLVLLTTGQVAARIEGAIIAGITKKMELVAIAAKASRTSRRKVLDVLERNTGPDPERHLWDYSKGHEHNTYRYFLHAPTQPEAPSVASEADQPVPPPDPEEERDAA